MLPPTVTTVVTPAPIENPSEELQELQAQVQHLENQQDRLQEIAESEPNPSPEMLQRISSLETQIQSLQAMIQSLSEMVEEATRVTELDLTPEPEPESEEVILVNVQDDIQPPAIEGTTEPSVSDVQSEESVPRRWTRKILFGA